MLAPVITVEPTTKELRAGITLAEENKGVDPTYVGYFVSNLLLTSLPMSLPTIIVYLAVGLTVAAIVTAVLVVKRTRGNSVSSESVHR